jgi:hypothetical protein
MRADPPGEKSLIRCVMVALLWGAVVAAPAAQMLAADPLKSAVELREKFSADVQQLAKWCEDNGLSDEARKTRHLLVPSDPYKLYVPVLPTEVGSAKLPYDASGKALEWQTRLDRLRHEHAVALFEMARRCVRNGRAGLAFELALIALQANPDYEPARRLFGYQKFHDQWRTLYEVRKLRAGFVWSDKFGWLPKGQLRRYEQGERFCDGRWISAADDAARHADIKSGWEIETEHYKIRTDHSIEAGVALGVKLERLQRLWQEMFLRYYASEADVVALFDGRAKPASAPTSRHRVVYFRDRDEYNRSLRSVMPNIEMSVGVYYDRPPCAYFFAGKDSDDRTLYHEATHQLFHESRPVAADVGGRANFWIVEGIALYFESLREDDGFYVLGGFDDERLHAAQYRLLHDNFYVPLRQLAGQSRESFQHDPQIRRLYSESAGLTHFLVHSGSGRYRDALVSYLIAVYTGRDGPTSLAELTGVSFGDLDKQYRQFLAAGPRQ